MKNRMMKFNLKYGDNLLKCKKANSRLHLTDINLFIPKCKRSQAEVVSTILLILLVFAASASLIAFIIPFITNILKDAKCSDYNGKVYFTNNLKYTCYDGAEKKLLLQVKFDGNLDKKDAESIKGLKIVVVNQTESKIFEIMPPNSNPLIVMYDGFPLRLPAINEEKTYNISNINAKPTQVIIYPVLKDNQNCAGIAHTINFVEFC